MYGKSENIDSNSQGSVTITPNNFSDDGCYIRSLARPNKGVMGVIKVKDSTFLLVKLDFFAFFQNFSLIFKNFPKFSRLFYYFTKIFK